MITEIEQETLDIDWFFTNNEDVAYVTSGGGRLPESVANSSTKNKLLVSFFTNLLITSRVIIDPNLNEMISPPANERYLACFIDMAEKGLFTFDKTILNNFSEPHYHLVAKPTNPIKIKDLPGEIRKLVSATYYPKNLESNIDISLIL